MIEGFTHKVCWTLIGRQEETFIWQKTTDPQCYSTRCEPFPTYPRTYDMFHANGLLSSHISEGYRSHICFLSWARSASYEQPLMDARKLIEKQMERFKISEKETKAKAFSKVGVRQQPKMDPKEKAKSETRDWLNNTVWNKGFLLSEDCLS
ncbi:hypothetical protein L1987_10317 [Smallanthus sonchifolius]|uniref:Uncharacterized protein n=1 Tax=Smallanthus sonchifolius TaxID=185202 RepID=A0ACB9JRR4_9ASTR|nr:hypothetical protein L1987_10317 [Smallanthus sonchifolius]